MEHIAGGSIRSAIDVQDARVEQGLNAYESTVLRALEEVEAAFINYHYEQAKNTSLRTAVASYRESVGFAEEPHQGGNTDFQNVLDAQWNLLNFGDKLAVSDEALASHLVAPYRAMGGGWQTDQAGSLGMTRGDSARKS